MTAKEKAPVEKLSLAPPIPFDPDVETITPDEGAVNADVAEVIASIISASYDAHRHAARGLHAKGHALLDATVEVHAGLPPELAQGVFRPGASYPALIRISSIAGDPLSDKVSLPRGLALKLIGVGGARLPGSEHDDTQDFLFASGPAFAAPDAQAFLGPLKLLASTTDRAEWAKAALSTFLRPVERMLEKSGHESALVKTMGGYPLINPLGDRYFTQASIRFGAYVAKLDILPESANFRALSDREIDLDGRDDAMRAEIVALLAKEGGAFTLRAQLRRDAENNPVEDASVAWPEADNPYLPLATVHVPAQAAWSDERARRIEDGMAFWPWHGVEAHRPLGNIMRTRRFVYPLSAEYRGSLNGCPIHEPKATAGGGFAP